MYKGMLEENKLDKQYSKDQNNKLRSSYTYLCSKFKSSQQIKKINLFLILKIYLLKTKDPGVKLLAQAMKSVGWLVFKQVN